MRQHIQVEYKDGTFQWIKYNEIQSLNTKEVKRICAYCSSDLKIDTKRYKKLNNFETMEIK